MRNSCLFCGAEGAGVLSKEHVIPQWLIKHLDLPEDDLLFQGVASSATETLVKPPRIHSSFSFVQGHVCEGCNNGWMSRLEDAAKPILIPLIDGQRAIESLSAEEADIVAKWTSKTAYMHSWTAPLKDGVQLEHLRALLGDGGKPFPGVGVFGMQSDFKQQSAYFLTGQWPHFCRPGVEILEETPAEAYKIGVQFRHLYLLTAFWPDPKSIFTLAQGIHIPVIATGQGQWPDHPIDFTVGDGAIDRLALFCNSLAVTHPYFF